MNDVIVDKLGPYPLLQLAAAILVLSGLAFAIYRGTRDGEKNPGAAAQNEQRYFFDGPVGEALKLLRDNRNINNEIKAHVDPLGEIGRNTNRLLDEMNRLLNEILVEMRDLKNLKSRRR